MNNAGTSRSVSSIVSNEPHIWVKKKEWDALCANQGRAAERINSLEKQVAELRGKLEKTSQQERDGN